MPNLRIFVPESNFHVNLPVVPAVHPQQEPEVQVHSIRVSLRSDREGNLTQLSIGQKDLGNDDVAFDRLSQEILKIVGRPGNPLTSDIEVELDADFECQYQYTVKAISHCTGQMDSQTRQTARYIDKIKFAAAHKPEGVTGRAGTFSTCQHRLFEFLRVDDQIYWMVPNTQIPGTLENVLHVNSCYPASGWHCS